MKTNQMDQVTTMLNATIGMIDTFKHNNAQNVEYVDSLQNPNGDDLEWALLACKKNVALENVERLLVQAVSVIDDFREEIDEYETD